ncbi:MAG TPA: M23 family metallopeptidase [Gemmatimonadaceae bacterium]|nr:M23 family metallopeptidase [Gemmatimonadaceae bacterium]
MKHPLLARIATLCVAGVLSAGILAYGLPDLSIPAPGVAMSLAPPITVPAWTQQVDTLEPGETVSGVLARAGLPGADIVAALEAAVGFDSRRVRAGTPVTVRTFAADTTPSELIFQLAIDRLLHLRRSTTGWSSEEVRLPWTTDTITVGGTIKTNLYDALDDGAGVALPPAARAELAWTIADIYEYRVDMSRELQEGDELRVLFERSIGPGGAVRIGKVLAARFVLSGEAVEAIRYASSTVGGDYFDQNGRSLRAAFLRTPVAFRRISSRFGMRRHPILGTMRRHQGIDYAASSGTPVRAIGDGVVLYAGRRGGYGNVLEIRHRNGFVSRYGHLRGFARGIHRGSRVTIAQTVAYVGSTGLSTAPHLHFEILVNGAHRNPRVALNQKGGEPIPKRERADFEGRRALLVASLDAGLPVDVATTDAP